MQIPVQDHVLDYLICGDYDLKVFQTLLKDLIQDRHGYYYVISHFKSGLVFHSDLGSNFFEQWPSLTELEFGVPDKERHPEAVAFNESILPLISINYKNRENWKKISTGIDGQEIEQKIYYQKKGVKMLVSISPIFLNFGDDEYYNMHIASVIYVSSGLDIITVTLNIFNFLIIILLRIILLLCVKPTPVQDL